MSGIQKREWLFKMENKMGMFIVFEGIDGSGKGTQLINSADYIKSIDKYRDIILTHEPWKSAEIKRKLKEDKDSYSDAHGMARLYIEDRVAHSEQINARLNEGYFVLCDRYKMSTCAYQWTQGVNLYKLFKLHEDSEIITPDLTLFIDIPAEIAQKRRIARGGEKEKFEDWKFQKDLVSHYSSLINRDDCYELFGNIAVMNGRGDANEVFKRVKGVFDSAYSKWIDEQNS